ncbi:Phage integrase family protein [Tenacibaculum sp. MAR_2010_89]|uniref:phage integrase SAM-like domain-containing protein n=1 Tax=Tenacibaculum sp. MAR_2010_89 TaxID=1250198 RepID=UPI00089BC172|nr:phage integrase SAM-like domain-containing protein [Tenacibaculum sp. MAR_2010_89]SED59808.1 Phage integrase family protein [Tenacibaculum sp. MAR_2010_89]
MASVKFFIKGKSNPTTIYVRLSASNRILLRKSTSLLINPDFFNRKKGVVKLIKANEGLINLNNDLEALKIKIITSYNKEISKGVNINSLWLTSIIDVHFDRVKESKLDFIINYADDFIKRLPTKTNPKGGVGVSIATIKKYKTIRRKLRKYEISRKLKLKLTDINLSFREDYLKFLLVDERMSMNTAGRDIKFVKTICLDAKNNGIEVSSQLESIKGFSVKVESIFLNFDEIEIISNTKFLDENLSNARDWLVMGCYLGQRVSDLLVMRKENIKEKGNLKVIELTQKKTKKKVNVLLHPKVIEILERRNWEFPKTFSNNLESNKTLFNKYIKEVAREAGLIYKVAGGKVNKKTNRKEKGVYKKYELITSHICRRSFASNYYATVPTPLLMSVTGHSTEKDFLLYIGKTSADYVDNLAKYWGL